MKDTPKYIAIANKIKHEIETGEYKINDQLPKEYDLANAYDVSRITIRNALQELENKGLIYRIQGAGTFVKEKKLTKEENVNQLEVLDLNKYKVKLLNFEVGNVSNDLCQKLKIHSYDIVYTIKRSFLFTKRLVAFQKMRIPAKVIQGLNMEMLESSIYPLISKKIGISPKNATRRITLAYSDQKLEKDIGIKQDILDKKEPLLKWTQFSYLEDGRPFEINETYYRISKYPIKEAIII